MATTKVLRATSQNTDLIPLNLGKELLHPLIYGTFWSKFGAMEDSDVTMPIVHKFDLTKKQGDQIKFHVQKKTTPTVKADDDAIEGNEGALTFDNYEVFVHYYRIGKKINGLMTEQSSAYKLRRAHMLALRDNWIDILDKEPFIALTGGSSTYLEDGNSAVINYEDIPSSNIIYGGDATAHNDLSTDDKFQLELLDRLVSKAETQEPQIKPIRVQGESYYVAVIHPYDMYHLRQDTTFLNSMAEARERGMTNPLISGAKVVWNNVIVFAHPRVVRFTDGGAGGTVNGSKCVFLGQNALCWAWANPGQNRLISVAPEQIDAAGAGLVRWVEKDSFDAYHAVGFYAGLCFGLKTPIYTFDSSDISNGSLMFEVASTDPNA